MIADYVHGYSKREAQRLQQQGGILAPLIHPVDQFAQGGSILEVGCGVGAQTVLLATQNPHSKITAIEINPESLATAKSNVEVQGLKNVEFIQGDVFETQLDRASYDYAFFCFVLEHLPDPVEALRYIRPSLNDNGCVIAYECTNDVFRAAPDYDGNIQAVYNAVSAYQNDHMGNAGLGGKLRSIAQEAGFSEVSSQQIELGPSERNVEFTQSVLSSVIVPVFRGMEDNIIEKGYIEEVKWKAGLQKLEALPETEGFDFSNKIQRLEARI